MKKTSKDYLITIPSHRLDIENKEDLVEELARIYGYNKISGSLPHLLQLNQAKIDEDHYWKNLIRQYLNNCGFQEIITYSLVSEEEKNDFCWSEEENYFYKLLFPKSENHLYYRQSILPSHLKTISYNLSHQNKDLLFFEIGQIYSLNSTNQKKEEILTLSGTGKIIKSLVHKLEQELDFFWMKGIVENFWQSLNIFDRISFASSSSKDFHPHQRADIFLDQTKVGFFGQIHPLIRQKYKIGPAVFGAQISLSKLWIFFPPKFPISYWEIPSFPKIERDLALIFHQATEAGEVIKIIKKIGGEFLVSVEIFDVYSDEKHKKNQQKSLSFRLIFQSSQMTLLSKKINEIVKNIAIALQNSLGAKLREK